MLLTDSLANNILYWLGGTTKSIKDLGSFLDSEGYDKYEIKDVMKEMLDAGFHIDDDSVRFVGNNPNSVKLPPNQPH